MPFGCLSHLKGETGGMQHAYRESIVPQEGSRYTGTERLPYEGGSAVLSRLVGGRGALIFPLGCEVPGIGVLLLLQKQEVACACQRQ